MLISRQAKSLVPGLLLTGLVAAGALALERFEVGLSGRAWLEALVLAILVGAGVRTFWGTSRRTAPGIRFAAKTLLELAVVLMGAAVSFKTLSSVGAPLVFAIVATVALAIATSFLIGRAMGLPAKMATLVACGNAICGNSAIAAVAPVIEARDEDVATAIAFTAVLGVVVVIALPVLAHVLGLSPAAGGALAGLTVYAVPQVLAAATPMGQVAVQLGTLVKLVRVLMLGPVVTVLSVVTARKSQGADLARPRMGLAHLLPPFILGFLGLAGLNSAGLLPAGLTARAHEASLGLTIMAMAALGLGVDLRDLRAAGPRVVFVVTASLLVLTLMAVAMVKILSFS